LQACQGIIKSYTGRSGREIFLAGQGLEQKKIPFYTLYSICKFSS
jgi:hypothetical protein